MKKGIFAQAWEEAMKKHQIYKKEKLERIEVVKKEIKEEVDEKATGFLGGIGLYYIQEGKSIFKKIFKSKK